MRQLLLALIAQCFIFLKVNTVPKRESQKAANRLAIIEAGVQVFTEVGYESATIRDIVRASGLASGTFYNYFQSKSEVLESMIQDITARLRNSVRDARLEAKNGREFILNGYHAFFNLLLQHEGLLKLINRNQHIFRSMIFAPDHTTGDLVVFQPLFDDLKEDLQWAIKKGYFRNINVDLTAQILISAGFEALLTLNSQSYSAAKMADLFFHGMEP